MEGANRDQGKFGGCEGFLSQPSLKGGFKTSHREAKSLPHRADGKDETQI